MHAISIVCMENKVCDLKVTMQDGIYPGHKFWGRTQQCTLTAKGTVISHHAQHYWTCIAIVSFLHTKAFWLKKYFLISLLSQNINHYTKVFKSSSLRHDQIALFVTRTFSSILFPWITKESFTVLSSFLLASFSSLEEPLTITTTIALHTVFSL